MPLDALSLAQTVLDVGCNFYTAWYYAKTQRGNTGTGICDNSDACVYGQTVGVGYSNSNPLTVQPWANLVDWTNTAVTVQVNQLDPAYVDPSLNPGYVNSTMWGWDAFTASFPGLTSVACSGPNFCVAVGAAQSTAQPNTNLRGKSTLLTTSDGGFSWNQYDFTAALTNFSRTGVPTADLNKVRGVLRQPSGSALHLRARPLRRRGF